MQVIKEVASENTEAILWNPLNERLLIQHNGRTYPLGPNQKMKASMATAKDCFRDFSHKGLVLLPSLNVSEEFLESKRKEAFKAVYDANIQALKDWNAFMTEERRRNGDSMLGEAAEVQLLKKKIYATEKDLKLPRRMAPNVYKELDEQFGDDGEEGLVSSVETTKRGRRSKPFIPAEGAHVNSIAAQG